MMTQYIVPVFFTNEIKSAGHRMIQPHERVAILMDGDIDGVF